MKELANYQQIGRDKALVSTNLFGGPTRRGKVRDVYSIWADGEGENELLLVATDRLSAFDEILATAIPGRGLVLTAISNFWFRFFGPLCLNHLITAKVAEMYPFIKAESYVLEGRTMLVKKTTPFPVECIVRGYLAGTAYKDYLDTGKVCGQELRRGLREGEKLDSPIFTPSTKAETGHDQNIGFESMVKLVGDRKATEFMAEMSMRLYVRARDYAFDRGIIIADTKFEFGRDEYGNVLLIDEVLTPDSSHFWDAETYQVGSPPPSFDKQFVRDYLTNRLKWTGGLPAPELPLDIVEATKQRYLRAQQLLVF